MNSHLTDQLVSDGLRLEAEGQPQNAERAYRNALAFAPGHVVALNSLGQLLAARGDMEAAEPYFRRATKANPSDAVSLGNLGTVLHALGDETGALAMFRRAVKANPAFDGARLNLANLLRSRGSLDEARPHYHGLLEQNANNGLARWNLGALEGLAGNVDAAFRLFAVHHAVHPAGPVPDLPRWRGEPLEGKRLLLDADQGLGDTIMFSRYVPALRERGAQVILRAQPQLSRLLASLDGLDSFVSREAVVPEADLWSSLVDLPAQLGPGSADGPWPSSYLRAPEDLRVAWSSKLPETTQLRVGLVWAGNPTHPDDHNRSIRLKTLLGPLTRVEGIELISLQWGGGQDEELSDSRLRRDLELESFADTAAVLEQLDLLVSVDTSILHLGGALGRPVWGLISYAPDWRWMLARRDSPWYPTLTLFRQPRPRDWVSVADEVAGTLRAMVAKRQSRP